MNETIHGTKGRILHSARGYDLIAWLMTFGRESAFRGRILDLGQLAPGDSVLDVGSGTGTLAIHAARRVAPGGAVRGIDASPGMVATARRKARASGADVSFEVAVVEALPFSDATFDAAFSTLMLHHLPRDARAQCARELRRVIKPGGRVVVVDFGKASSGSRLFAHFHKHGRVELDEIARTFEDAGFEIASRGALGLRDLAFVVGRKP